MTLTRWLSRLVGCYALTLASPLGAQGLDPPPKAAADPPPGAASEATAPAAAPPAGTPAPLSEPPEWAEPLDDPDGPAPAGEATAEQLAHALHPIADAMNVVAPLIIQLIAVVLVQSQRKAVDGA